MIKRKANVWWALGRGTSTPVTRTLIWWKFAERSRKLISKQITIFPSIEVSTGVVQWMITHQNRLNEFQKKHETMEKIEFVEDTAIHRRGWWGSTMEDGWSCQQPKTKPYCVDSDGRSPRDEGISEEQNDTRAALEMSLCLVKMKYWRPFASN